MRRRVRPARTGIYGIEAILDLGSVINIIVISVDANSAARTERDKREGQFRSRSRESEQLIDFNGFQVAIRLECRGLNIVSPTAPNSILHACSDQIDDLAGGLRQHFQK